MICSKLWRSLAVVFAPLILVSTCAFASSTVTYFHNDVSGTPQIETDANGAVVWKESYQPYGARTVNAAASGDNKLWFHEKSYDATSGLSYSGARYYDPVLGRFAGMDPAAVDPTNPHSVNRYTYGDNNPYKYVDRNGKNPLLLLREYVLVYNIATNVGAGLLGTLAAAKIYDVLHPDPFATAATSEESKGDPKPAAEVANSASPPEPPPGDDHRANAASGKESDPADKSGKLTRAGRALQKHGSREGSAFPSPQGGPAQMNAEGQNILERITRSSSRIEPGNRFGGVDVYHESGMGARFDADGTFRGFLEPPRT